MARAEWKPVEGKIMTRWAKEVSPENALPEYPRPQMRRDSWVNLNGLWAFDLLPRNTFFRGFSPTSEKDAQLWRATENSPGNGWFLPGFDDSAWDEKPGGFGNAGTPGAKVVTPWTSTDLWLRRTFKLESVPDGDLTLRIHHDEDVNVYLNGVHVFSGKGFLSGYINLPLIDAGIKALKPGENVLAVHVKQTIGGQYIDVGVGVLEYSCAAAAPDYRRKILVPYPVESALSGIGEAVQPGDIMHYRRTFSVPDSMKGKRVLLHFGAVDWEAQVFVNGTEMGVHRGGHAPFHFDVTDALSESGEQEIHLVATDPTNKGLQPIGKQHLNPYAVWYTAVSGIWGTVWLEAVPQTYIAGLRQTADIDKGQLVLDVDTSGIGEGWTLVATAYDSGKKVAKAKGACGEPLVLELPEPKLWSPDSPFLYDLTVELKKGWRKKDCVDSYFGMRAITVEKDKDGINRLFLNGKALFQYGTLDQGWWPDGLYTAPTDAALRYDVEITKELGFNLIRKHIKAEPLRWYTHCDQVGMLVWQDMPSSHFSSSVPVQNDEAAKQNFYHEWGEIMDSLINHPCIVMWVPFNESWGQFDAAKVSDWTEARDPSRLVNNASGWHDMKAGHVRDLHKYPGPVAAPLEENRAVVLGEFGAVGYAMKGHTWKDKTWGHSMYESLEEARKAYDDLQDKLRPLVESALAAAVYTQITDVEEEVNGLLTYDREVLKFDLKRLQEQHRLLIEMFKGTSTGEE